jgi:hypothetical protein
MVNLSPMTAGEGTRSVSRLRTGASPVRTGAGSPAVGIALLAILPEGKVTPVLPQRSIIYDAKITER